MKKLLFCLLPLSALLATAVVTLKAFENVAAESLFNAA